MAALFMGLAIVGITLIPLTVIGISGETIAIKTGYLHPWDFR